MRFVVQTISVLVMGFSVSHAATPKKASVLVMDAQPQALSDSLSFPGRVRSRINAIQTSEIEGQVIKIDKPLGAKVRKGDVILTLQNTDPVYRYAPIKVRTTANGYVTSLDVSLMAKVDRGQKLFAVTDPQDLIIEAEIPAQDAAALKLGLAGEFKPDPLQDEKIKVKVEGFSPLIDVRSGTATAEFKPTGDLASLRQGQLGQIILKTNERESFLLPESAVIYRDEKPFVRVFENGKVKKIAIELGKRNGESFEVKKGLDKGQQIVTRASRFISDGEDVEIQKPEKQAN